MAFRVCYKTHEFDGLDIHLRTLRNNQEFFDKDGEAAKLGISSATWPLFGITWPAGIVLAHYLLGLDLKQQRILEVGCGIGLSSLLLNHLNMDVTATDYHPEAEGFLIRNAQLNQDDIIPFVRTDWADPITELGLFDVIVGSDLLYEDEHVDLLAQFILQHCHANCRLVIVDPGRGRHARFSRQMAQSGFELTMTKPRELPYLDEPFKGVVLHYHRQSLDCL